MEKGKDAFMQTIELAYCWSKLYLRKNRNMPEIGGARKHMNWLEGSPWSLSLSKTQGKFLLCPSAVVYQRGSSHKEYEIRSKTSDPHEPHKYNSSPNTDDKKGDYNMAHCDTFEQLE